ncbi:carbonic anhydrase [Shewanella sp. JM162201]|uniref:Carbonic anhydrase n=1 Tax=Shewanella jiangmenensis TaxID=2837387 RepID=A0ABS5V5Z3_9GAMM|nr:carbonic anhydrase [Shewanella jiangmenensis]MBT1445869.1 carbonic anhydrase [Shewanella jiangmenensis]
MSISFTKTLIAGALLAVCGNALAGDGHWSYEGKGAPEYWGSLKSEFALCKDGVNQSPIDIRPVADAPLSPLQLDYQGKVTSVINNGHTLQANFGEGNSLTLEGNRFELKQVHMHAPSENTINGKQYPLEAHFVHADSDGRLAVIGIMFEEGASNSGFATLSGAYPKSASDAVPFSGELSPNAFFPKSLDYYRFSGSLTTPPCSEGVRWVVLKDVQTLSADELKAFTKLYPNNARPVQPVNARIVVQ